MLSRCGSRSVIGLCVAPPPGVAVADGEAHRHEPPIPHDKVLVDQKKDQNELREEEEEPGAGQAQEAPNKGGEEGAEPQGKKEAVHVAEKAEANEVIEKPAAANEEKDGAGAGPPHYKDVDNHLPEKEVHAGKVEEHVVVKEPEQVPEQPAGKRESE